MACYIVAFGGFDSVKSNNNKNDGVKMVKLYATKASTAAVGHTQYNLRKRSQGRLSLRGDTGRPGTTTIARKRLKSLRAQSSTAHLSAFFEWRLAGGREKILRVLKLKSKPMLASFPHPFKYAIKATLSSRSVIPWRLLKEHLAPAFCGFPTKLIRAVVECHQESRADALDKWTKAVRIKKSGIAAAGKGLFAAKKFAADEVLGVYAGDLFAETHEVLSRRDYVFTLSDVDSRDKNDLLLADWVIDARQRGNYTRFVNADEKNPNVVPYLLILPEIEEPIVVLVTCRAVRENEEFFMPYGRKYWDGKKEGRTKITTRLRDGTLPPRC
jgi:hypothetical protein